MPDTLLRQATRADVPGIWRVRYAVTENTLTPGRISDHDVRREIEVSGRGWVVERDGEIIAFAIGNLLSGNIWALFVHPAAQGHGHGGRLHDAMLAWMLARGTATPWLTTGPETRACAFYERRGWRRVGLTEDGEARYEFPPPDGALPAS